MCIPHFSKGYLYLKSVMKKNLHILRRGDGCAADGVAAGAVFVVVTAAGTGVRQQDQAGIAGRGSAQVPVRWLS